MESKKTDFIAQNNKNLFVFIIMNIEKGENA